MKRFPIPCTFLALFGVAVALFSAAQSTAANLADESTVKEVIHKELIPTAKAMAKNEQLKGSDESWTNLAVGYAKAAAELEKTAAHEDANVGQFSSMECIRCHKHR